MENPINSTNALSMNESQDEKKPLWKKDKPSKLKALLDSFRSCCLCTCDLILERKALFLVFLSCFFYAFRNLAAKVITETVDPIEIAVFERTTMMICCVPMILYKQYSMRVSREIAAILVATGVINCLSMILVILSFKLINVGDANAIVATKPVFVGILGWILLREIPTLLDYIAGAACIVGIVFLSKPTIIFDTHALSHDANLYGVIAAVSGTLLTTVAAIFKRLLGLKEVQPQVAIFYFSLVSSFTSCVLCTIFQKWTWPQSPKIQLFLVGSGFLGYLANVCLLIALWTEKTFHVTIIGSSTVIIVFFLQFVLLHVSPDVYSIIGSIFVLIATVAITMRKTKTPENTSQ